MLHDTLPNQVDVRKLAVNHSLITAEVSVSSLPRYADLLADQTGTVQAKLQFYTDEQHRRRVDGALKAKVNVICQRCLEPMPLLVDTQFTLGIVWSEGDSKRLPDDIEPLIVAEELVDLADIVSEELILCFPHVSFHDSEQCPQPVGYVSRDTDDTSAEDASEGNSTRENPFKVLEQLIK